MTEDNSAKGRPPGHDLRTIVARLADIQRKCRSAASRNNEAAEMEQRLASILERLGSDGDDDDPIPFAMLARELFAVERFFESNGFLSVAKEVAHVERLLEGLAAPDEVAAPPATAPSSSGPVASTVEVDDGAGEPDLELEETVSRWSVPKPLAAVMVVFVVAVAVCAVVIGRHQRATAAAIARPLALPTAVPTSSPPTPVPAISDRRTESGPAPGAVLAKEVGQARLAIVDGDVDAAIDHLSRAALVDADHATVLSTAAQLVDLLVTRADGAAVGGLWEIADLTLNRADSIAVRFGLDTHRIEEARLRYSRMDRFRLIQPAETAAIRAAAGSRVTVFFDDGSTRESIISGVEDGLLLLDEDTEVRGGAMYYVERIPLATIDYLKVWED
jgi:hypothetical protein